MERRLVSYDLADRLVHAHDASLYRLVPHAVARPRTCDDVLKLMKMAQAQNLGLTFRTGGTSLSGQAVTHGILALLGEGWGELRIEGDGQQVTCGPAVRGGVVNARLAPLGRRIGPDPASLQAACLGGIVANNASGMCCGTEENSYQTLFGMTVILPSGTMLDTRKKDADEKLRLLDPEIYSGLLNLRTMLLANESLTRLVKDKSQTKNTTGYGLQALIDYSSPAQILAHLMVGSEGTLGFIADVTLNTVPLRPHRASALLSFDTLESACGLSETLRNLDFSAVELFDYAAVQAIVGHPGVPGFLQSMNRDGACLLIQAQQDDADSLRGILERAQILENQKEIVGRTEFFSDSIQQNQLWDLRKGIFPAVGGRRPKGTSVIIEDVAFPLKKLASGTRDLRALLHRCGYDDAVIYGHARDGNLHFVLAQDFSQKSEVKRYETFIDQLVELVAVDYSGALKAEHGTGRNMAPFVEREWGTEAYELMKKIKRLFDPQRILNPGVLINSDHRAHLKDLKTTPTVDSIIDPCIECGFCEPVCPSQGFTLSPRGRIALQRELHGQQNLQHVDSESLNFQLLDTCAADGLCSRACPVGINTGDWVKKRRADLQTHTSETLANWCAKEASMVEKATRTAVAGASALETMVGGKALSSMTRAVHRLFNTPVWHSGMNGVREQNQANVQNVHAHPDFLVFRSCITRMFGTSNGELMIDTAKPRAALSQSADSLETCARRAGVELKIIAPAGVCCGQPWSSKGFPVQAQSKLSELIEVLFEESEEGKIPVVIDNSPCVFSALNEAKEISAECKRKLAQLRILDPVELALILSEKLTLKPISEPSRFFSVCSLRKMGQANAFEKLAHLLCQRPIFPSQEACCGMAGDRGLWHPELIKNASARLQWEDAGSKKGYCTSRTCEVALSADEAKFASIFDALEAASRVEE